jgi:2-polyprenyl-3-methyl-5-hydroxy-6-metoxy-1,4-benzoquinol methylase
MRKENIVNERDEYKYFKNKHLDRIDTIWLKPVLDDILNKFTWAKMLDHGCGNGLVGSYLKGRSNGILIGVDASRYGLEQASLKGYDDTVLVKDLSSERLPFDDGVFDFVMSSDVIEHLLDPSYAIDEIFRVLNPKGRLLISVPNPF